MESPNETGASGPAGVWRLRACFLVIFARIQAAQCSFFGRWVNRCLSGVASAGVFGAALLLAYFARCLMAPLARGRGWRAGPDARDTLAHGWAQAIVGARLAWLACLVPAASVATTVDMSLNALFFAIMATAGLAITTAEGSDSDAACPAPGGRAARRKQRLVGQRIPRAAHAATRDLGNSRMQRVPNAAGRCL